MGPTPLLKWYLVTVSVPDYGSWSHADTHWFRWVVRYFRKIFSSTQTFRIVFSCLTLLIWKQLHLFYGSFLTLHTSTIKITGSTFDRTPFSASTYCKVLKTIRIHSFKLKTMRVQNDTFFYHHFDYYATFLFKTLLNTLQYASVNHTLYGKCVMLPQLNWARRNKDGTKLSRKIALASVILTSKRL